MPADNLLIVNPVSGAGRGHLGRLHSRVSKSLGATEMARTRRAGDATRIAREAVRAGVSRLVVGGGDGTLSEVVEGLLAAGLGREAEIGLIPLGTACDRARGLGVSRDPKQSIRWLAEGQSRCIDAGRVRYRDSSGATRERFFLNETSFGISGEAVFLMNRAWKRLAPGLAFRLAALAAIAKHTPIDVGLEVDGRRVHTGPISMVVAAQGSFFGGGIRVAPDARSDDGQLDLVVVDGLSRAASVRKMRLLNRGTHIEDAAVAVYRGQDVVIEVPRAGPVPMDVDGEAIYGLPQRIETLPGAIRIFGLPDPEQQV